MDGYAVRSADVRARSGDPARDRHERGRPRLHRRRRTAARPCASSPARRCRRAPTASSSRKTPRPRRRRVIIKETARAGPASSARPGSISRPARSLLQAGRVSMRRAIALAAAMGHGTLPVRRRPRVAILATGDELVLAGRAARARPDRRLEPAGPAGAWSRRPAARRSISASPATRSKPSKSASLRAKAARCRHPRHARRRLRRRARSRAVGAQPQGMELGFWRVALRPGKPLMHGRLGAMLLLGLPGNPVSSIVCAILFLVPAIRALLGRRRSGGAIRPKPRSSARISRRTTTGRITCARRSQPDDAALRSRLLTRCRIRPCSASSPAPTRSSCERLTRPPPKAGDRCRIIRLRALLLSVAARAWRWTCGTQQNSYLVPALFQNRSTGWSSKGQPC